MLAGLIDGGLPEDGKDLPAILKQLIGTAYGEGGPTGEYVRGLVRLEAEERDRLARFLKICIEADLGERLVRVEEASAAAFVMALRATLTDLGIDPTSDRAVEVMGRRLREIEGSTA